MTDDMPQGEIVPPPDSEPVEPEADEPDDEDEEEDEDG